MSDEQTPQIIDSRVKVEVSEALGVLFLGILCIILLVLYSQSQRKIQALIETTNREHKI